MTPDRPPAIRIGIAVWRRSWLVFSATALLSGMVWIAIDGANPLASIEPYGAGLLFGCPLAGWAALYSLAEEIRPSSNLKHWLYGGILTAWSLFWLLLDLLLVVRGGVGTLIAVSSLGLGLFAWPFLSLLAWPPLYRFHPPRWFFLMLSLGGVLFVGMYGVVIIRMILR